MTTARRSSSPKVDRPALERLLATFREQISSLVPSVKADHLKTEIFSKFVSADTAPADVRRARAVNKWLATERENEATCDRLILTPQDQHLIPGVSAGRFISSCQDLIRQIIGDSAPLDALIGSFSGGASTSRPRTSSHPARKYLGKAHITPRCRELFEEVILPEMPLWQGYWNEVDLIDVPGNVMFTVPKKSDIDRCACKEPDINMFVQKGIGNYFRDCLRKHGINLNDQSRNRSLALRGSVTNDLATLDLSSASDSVSTELVFMMLPECWFTLLDSVRSHVTIIDGVEHRNHMFSSMGNGFTFELESLLFYAIARTVSRLTGTRGIVSVYGDDIICPTAAAPLVIDVLSWFGFETNESKSYLTGPFRESCGGHYWNGYDITPFYVKEPLSDITSIIDLANKLRHWAGLNGYTVLDPEVEPIWEMLKAQVPSHLWGGADTSYKYQLVSYDVSHSKLVPTTKSWKTGIGGYLHWHNATWGREQQTYSAMVASSASTSLGGLRTRKVRDKTVPRLTQQFLHEITGNAE